MKTTKSTLVIMFILMMTLFCSFSNSTFSQEKDSVKVTYVCPPCGGSDCDKLKFDKPGECPGCGMTLISVNKSWFEANYIDGEIKLTGKLDDPLWRYASETELKYEIQPGENITASQKTFVKVAYNKDFLYFGFDCKDTRISELRAQITERDKIFDNDLVFAWIDTYGDNQKAYSFLTNPHGIQADLIKTGIIEDASYDAVWYSEASINDSGWTAEMAIPFKSLRFPPGKEQQWTLTMGRIYPREFRYWFFWTPFDRNNPSVISQGNNLSGIKDVEPSNALEILPFLVGSKVNFRNNAFDPTSDFTKGPVKGRIGAGIKYAPSTSLMFEGVINPDFSQVESDATQISVNTTFAIFYPEKRPFFVEGSNLFKSSANIFYSRMINDPVAAGKVTGKYRTISYGLITASDRNTPFIIPDEERSYTVSTNLNSYSAVARGRLDFGNESFIGVIGTSRFTKDAYNFVGGVDWSYRFFDNFFFKGEFFKSSTKEESNLSLLPLNKKLGSTEYTAGFNGEKFGGTAYSFEVSRLARDYSFGLFANNISPTFQAHNGFVSRNNLKQLRFDQQYLVYVNNNWLDRFYFYTDASLRFNNANVRKERYGLISGGLMMKGQTDISGGYYLYNEETFRNVTFDNLNKGFASISAKPSSHLGISLRVETGNYIYRINSPVLGSGHIISSEVKIKPISQLQIALSYSRSRLADKSNDDLLYDGYIIRSVMNYQFNKDISLRLITQYDHFRKVVDVYPLLSYRPNPFTIFYAGYTNTLQDYGDQFGFRQTSNQMFIKIQYLFQQ